MESLFYFPQFKITKKIRLIELFGGIGSQAMALRDIGADFEHYKLVEFDKYAVKSYNAIHDTRHTTHDIRDIHAKDLEIKDKDKYCYLMTYSFPCQSLSVAGKMEGMSREDWENGNSTRSGLLWEVERILKECIKEELPDVLLMENVPQVHAEQNEKDFNAWLNFLKSKGYKNFWKDLNGKDYGIPQNRVRCFCVSFLSDDDFMELTFPKPVKLEKVMKDFLEETVDEKYYINNEKAKKLIAELIESGVLPTDNRQQTTDYIEETRCVGGLSMSKWGTQYHQQDRVYKGDIALAQPANLPEGSYKYIVASRGRNPLNPNDRKKGSQDVTHTITAQGGENINYIETIYRIRKLTPKECWRLMGYTDGDFEKAASVNSNTQLYKQAGNAIIKQVLMAIFSKML